MYVVNKVQSISACGSSLYLIDSYLIIDDAKFSDTGEYIFDIGLTSERNFRHSSQNMTAVVTTKGNLCIHVTDLFSIPGT